MILGIGSAILLVSAWLFAAERGVASVAAGMAFGWMVRHLTPMSGRAASVVHSSAIEPGPIASRAIEPEPVETDFAAERLRQLEARTASLRHDLRGILSPALLIGERLLTNEDPAIHRAGEIMVKTVERASARMAESKG